MDDPTTRLLASKPRWWFSWRWRSRSKTTGYVRNRKKRRNLAYDTRPMNDQPNNSKRKQDGNFPIPSKAPKIQHKSVTSQYAKNTNKKQQQQQQQEQQQVTAEKNQQMFSLWRGVERKQQPGYQFRSKKTVWLMDDDDLREESTTTKHTSLKTTLTMSKSFEAYSAPISWSEGNDLMTDSTSRAGAGNANARHSSSRELSKGVIKTTTTTTATTTTNIKTKTMNENQKSNIICFDSLKKKQNLYPPIRTCISQPAAFQMNDDSMICNNNNNNNNNNNPKIAKCFTYTEGDDIMNIRDTPMNWSKYDDITKKGALVTPTSTTKNLITSTESDKDMIFRGPITSVCFKKKKEKKSIDLSTIEQIPTVERDGVECILPSCPSYDDDDDDDENESCVSSITDNNDYNQGTWNQSSSIFDLFDVAVDHLVSLGRTMFEEEDNSI